MKVLVKFPKANIIFAFLLFGFGEWVLSDLLNFSGGNLGFIILCLGGYFYFKTDKPKFNEPSNLKGWVKVCEEDIDFLNQFESSNNIENKTNFRKNVLRDILVNHEKQLITFIGDSGSQFYKTLTNKYFNEGTYNLNVIDELPSTSFGEGLTNTFLKNDMVFYHLSLPLTAKSLLWLNKIPTDMKVWLLISFPNNANEKEQIEDFKSEIPIHYRQKIINLSEDNVKLYNIPLTLRINSINSGLNIESTQKRLLKELHTRWQAEIEVIRRVKLRDVQKKNQLLVAATVFASPVPSVDVLSMTVLNGLMINEIKSIWDCQWSPEILEKISKEILKTAITQGVVEWSGQAFVGLSKFHGPNWLIAGSFQAISAAYLTRVVSRSLADFMAINKGVIEPDLEYIKNNSEKIVQNAFQSEKVNWQSFLTDFPNTLKFKFT